MALWDELQKSVNEINDYSPSEMKSHTPFRILCELIEPRLLPKPETTEQQSADFDLTLNVDKDVQLVLAAREAVRLHEVNVSGFTAQEFADGMLDLARRLRLAAGGE